MAVDRNHLARPATPDRVSRSSFSSIRENESVLPQDFSHSKVSSFLNTDEAISDDGDHSDTRSSSPPHGPDHQSAGRVNMIQTQFQPPLTHPNSRLLGYWTPSDSFQGWKGINVKGKLASKSFGDLQVLHKVWTTPLTSKAPKKDAPKPGASAIERLPVEIANLIGYLAIDVPPNGIARRNVDLVSLLLTSKTMHLATLDTLYRHITIPHSKIFYKFLMHISERQALGTLVRRIDFCHFNPSQLFSTAAERKKAKNLTSETLLRCLELTPSVQEFLAQEYIDDDLSADVLRKLFLGLQNIKALDFCGCSSQDFRKAFSTIVEDEWPSIPSLERVSFHKCMTLAPMVFERILPSLPRLTHLDVAGTRITDAALMSIPRTARLTHLNIAKCKLLSARTVIEFLTNHPAAKNLVFLSIAADARTDQPYRTEDINELLPILPKTLKSLSLKGARMEEGHMDLLRPLTKHLEELSIGRGVKLQDVNRLLVPDETDDVGMQVDWVPHTLKFLDLSDMWSNDLDLNYMLGNECAVLKSFSAPLTVVELAEDVFKRVSKSLHTLERIGWRTSECGVRAWIVRQTPNGEMIDDGRRKWKMGAESWGMRKVSVAVVDVGGMYGSYMFGRRI